ncbi:MAG: hypothetical protein ACXW1B_03650, partial [Nitrososphaeraceae archaeon]
AASAWVKVQFKLLNGLLGMREWVPLRYLRNLRIIIDWAPAWMCMLSGRPSFSTDAKSSGIQIRNLRYIMSVVEPVDSVLAIWDEKYRSDMGLVYHYPDFYNHRHYKSSSASTEDYIIPASFVSVRAVITALYLKSQMIQSDSAVFAHSVEADGAVAESFSIDKVGVLTHGKIDEYEYVVGSERYPRDGRVKLDIQGGENFLHNLKTLHRSADKNLAVRFKPQDLRAIHPTTLDLLNGNACGGSHASASGSANSLKTIFTGDFTKEGELSGVSLRMNDLQAVYYRSTQSAWASATFNMPLTYQSWIVYDRVVQIKDSTSGAICFM